MLDFFASGKGVDDAADVLSGQFVVVRHLDKFIGSIQEQNFAVIAVLFQHHDAGGDGCAEKQIGRKLDDAVDKIVVDEVFADLLFRPTPVHDPRETDDGRSPAGRQPGKGMHNKGKVRLGFRSQHPGGGKTRIVDQDRVVVPFPFDGIGRIGDDQLKRFFVPVCRVGQRVLTGDVEVLKPDVMQMHVDAAEVVSGDVDLLTEKALADILFPEDLGRFQQQRTGAAGGVYCGTVFDTVCIRYIRGN